MNVVVVIVTYGDRFHFLKRVIDAVLAQGIDRIVVIDNSSVENSKTQLKALEKELNGILHVTYLDRNYGSAGGFKRGIQDAEKLDKDFIYILDDDNVPEQNAIQILIDFWNENNFDADNSIISSLRVSKNIYSQCINNNNPYLMMGVENSFMGFDLFNYFSKRIRRKKVKSENVNTAYGRIAFVPYGGMFFDKNLLKNIGYPNDDFYLYEDDKEFCYRVIKNNGNIFIVCGSQITDIDFWISEQSKKKFLSSSFLDSDQQFRVYYLFRNRTYFDFRNRVNCKLIYFMNMFIFLSKLFLSALIYGELKRFKLICCAVNDGLKGKLGEKDFKNGK